MTGWQVKVGLALGVAASLSLLWLGNIPFGVAGEWTWDRVDIPRADFTTALLGIVVGAIAGVIYIGVAWIGLKRIDSAPRWESAGWFSGLTLSGFLLLSAMQSVSTDPTTEFKSVWVLYDRGASGYFFDSVRATDDTASFLTTYESKMAQGDVLHIGTHPPGLFLCNRGLLKLCAQSNSLSTVVLATQPVSTAEAFDELERHARLLPRKLSRSERAALWLSVLLTQALAAATVVPLFFLIAPVHGRRAGWMAATFWPLVPAVAVFLPKSDALLALLGIVFLWAWCAAVRRRSVLLAFVAGGLFWLGMMFSLALLPVGLLAVLLTCWETWIPAGDAPTAKQRLGRNAILAGCATIAFLAATAAVWSAFQLNLFNVWAWNLHNHAGFYDQVGFPRTYWKWLLVNPIELAVATGWPIVLFAIAGALRDFRARRATNADPMSDSKSTSRMETLGPAVCSFAVWSILWLSGRNMGEAARLWLFLMPWLMWVGGAFWSPTQPTEIAAGASPSRRFWIVALGTQLLVCLLTVARVNGFQFGG